MDIVVILLVLAVGLLLLVVAAGLFLPANWQIDKAELIQALPTDIFPMINDLQQWEEWTVWYSQGGFDFEYSDNTIGQGASQRWKSNRINGSMYIQSSNSPKQLNYILSIQEGNIRLIGTIILAPADTNFTQVAWRCQLEELQGINPIRRFQAYLLKSYFEKAIEDSLLSLQSIFKP